MPRETTVTAERAAEAILALRATQQTPTMARVREALGGGSYSSLTRVWREAMALADGRQAATAPVPGADGAEMPEALAHAVQAVVAAARAMVAEARADGDRRAALAHDAGAAAAAASAAERDAAMRAVEEIGDQLAAVEARAEAAESGQAQAADNWAREERRAQDLESQAVDWRQRHGEMAEALAAAERRCGEAEERAREAVAGRDRAEAARAAAEERAATAARALAEAEGRARGLAEALAALDGPGGRKRPPGAAGRTA